MGVRSRVERLEAKAGRRAAPIVVVVEDGDGLWTDPRTGAPVRREEVPPGALLIVVALRPDGPQ